MRVRRTGQTYILKAGDALYDGEVARVSATELVLRRRLSEGGETREIVLRPGEVARADEMPLFDVDSHEVPTKVNPLGAKGVGEAGTVGALPALLNAVNHALAPLGVRHLDMPLTPERVWHAMQNGSR